MSFRARLTAFFLIALVGSTVAFAQFTGGGGGGGSGGSGVPANLTLTNPASAATFTLIGGKTATVDNTLEFAGTDATKMTFPATSQTIPGTGQNNSYANAQSFTSVVNMVGGVFEFNGNAAWKQANPSCAMTGGGTCADTHGNSGAAFEFTLASAGSASAIVITPGFTASNGFNCRLTDTTAVGTVVLDEASFTTTTATLNFYSRTTGSAVSPGASDILVGSCTGF